MKRTGIALFLGVVLMGLFIGGHGYAQKITIDLNKRTIPDDEGIHAEVLMNNPGEELILPASIDSSQAKFLTLHYSKDIPGDRSLSVLVISKEKGERFYIDKDNDEDLSDEHPLFFPADSNEFVFRVSQDSLQYTDFVLWRVPPRNTDYYMDEDGNMKPRLAKFMNSYGTETSGKKGTFFFDDKKILSRGHVVLGGKTYEIGVFDYNYNGLYNDSEDLLFIDLGQDEKLRFDEDSEVFKLNDIFKVEGENYKISEVDPYGRHLQLARTSKAATHYYLTALNKASASSKESGRLDASFWDLTLTTLEGKAISLDKYKGQYVLLNIWGEWCSPCIHEIPFLKKATEKYENHKLLIVGLLHTKNLDQAKKVIKEKNINWPQVHLSEELAERFRLRGFPTNILIHPDGVRYVKKSTVTTVFFDKNIR